MSNIDPVGRVLLALIVVVGIVGAAEWWDYRVAWMLAIAIVLTILFARRNLAALVR